MFTIIDKARRTDTGIIINILEINEMVEIFLKYHEETGKFNKKQHMLTEKLAIKKYIGGMWNFEGISDNI